MDPYHGAEIDQVVSCLIMLESVGDDIDLVVRTDTQNLHTMLMKSE